MRGLLFTISILLSISIHAAKGTYQIDLILFAQPQADKERTAEPKLPLIQNTKNTILLTPAVDKSYAPYTLLAPSQSSLRDEYYLLNRKSNYSVLAHYSWRQTAQNQKTVTLPEIVARGWHIQGTINLVQSTYYTFKAHLQCSSSAQPERTFSVTQKQRLQANKTYYLDHRDLGMIVKIHQIS